MAAPVFAPRGRRDVVRPTLGVFLDRPPIQVPERGLQDCLNVRVRNGQIRNERMGWQTFPAGETAINLDGEQVLLIANFFLRSGAQFLILGNRFDLFRFVEASSVIRYLTPVYNTGSITAAVYSAGPDETTLTGSGTLWATDPGDRDGSNNAIANDQIHIGDNAQADPAAAWFPVVQVNSDTEMVVSGDATAGFPGTFDYTLRQRFSGDNLDTWRHETFPAFDTGSGLEDRWYATNGVDSVVRWRGLTLESFATRVDLGFTCRILRRFKNIMLYGDLTEVGERKPQSIRSSDVGKPEDVTNGLASEHVPLDGLDDLMELLPLGDTLAAYGNRSVNTMEFVGDPFIFVSRTVITGIGLIARDALIDYGDFHEFLAADSKYRFNGVGIEESGGHVFREVLRTVSPARLAKMKTHIDEELGDAHWVMPLTTDNTGDDGGPKRAFTEHYLELVGAREPTPVTIRELPATALGFFERGSTLTWDQVLTQWQNTNFRWDDNFFQASFPFNLFGDEDGFVYILGATEFQHDGTQTLPITSFARTGRRAAIDGQRAGWVKRVEPFASKRASAMDFTLSVRVYGTDRAHGDVVLLDDQGFDLTHEGERFVPLRASARYIELEFGTEGADQPWDLDGWALVAVATGAR